MGSARLRGLLAACGASSSSASAGSVIAIGWRVAAGQFLKVLALLEADTVTGPAANLLQFHRTARCRIQLVVAVFKRGAQCRGSTDAVAVRQHSPLFAVAEAAGLPLVSIPERRRFDVRTLTAVRRLVGRLQPDIVQTHSVKSHLLAVASGVARAHPWIAFHHGYTRPDLKMAIYNQFDRVSLRCADRVVTTAKAFVGELTAIGVPTDRIAVVHNAIDVDSAHANGDRRRMRASIGVCETDRVVVCIGRLSREKGHRDLIDALAILRERDAEPPVRLVIAGDGPERSALVAHAERVGVASCIRWLGYRAGAHRLYAAADAAVLPSHSEGSPNALLEAAAHRLPIVATSVGGVPEIVVHGESALLVAPQRPDLIASSLRQVFADPARAAALGDRARAAIEARHDPTARARELIALYEAVAHRRALVAAAGARACAY